MVSCDVPWILVKLFRDLTRPKNPPKGSGLEGKSPAISGKSRLVKYDHLAGSLCDYRYLIYKRLSREGMCWVVCIMDVFFAF